METVYPSPYHTIFLARLRKHYLETGIWLGFAGPRMDALHQPFTGEARHNAYSTSDDNGVWIEDINRGCDRKGEVIDELHKGRVVGVLYERLLYWSLGKSLLNQLFQIHAGRDGLYTTDVSATTDQVVSFHGNMSQFSLGAGLTQVQTSADP